MARYAGTVVCGYLDANGMMSSMKWPRELFLATVAALWSALVVLRLIDLPERLRQNVTDFLVIWIPACVTAVALYPDARRVTTQRAVGFWRVLTGLAALILLGAYLVYLRLRGQTHPELTTLLTWVIVLVVLAQVMNAAKRSSATPT